MERGSLNLQLLVKEHLQSGALATLVVRDRQTQRYFQFDHEKRLVGWINKLTVEKIISVPECFDQSVSMAFSGIHVVSPGVFDLMPPGDKFSMTGFYLELAKNHLVKGYFDQSEIWMDVGKPEQLEEARKLIAR